jgi:hypothetical protein
VLLSKITMCAYTKQGGTDFCVFPLLFLVVLRASVFAF